jgi:hypothetical protein
MRVGGKHEAAGILSPESPQIFHEAVLVVETVNDAAVIKRASRTAGKKEDHGDSFCAFPSGLNQDGADSKLWICWNVPETEKMGISTSYSQ